MSKKLFADSGGTGTDWGYLDNNGEKITFKTESYHPVNWTDSFWTRIEEFWKTKESLLDYSLHFYCAGCLNADKARLLNEKFKSIGFKEVQVLSDLHAAGYACVQNGTGSVIIAGTGSVFFDFSQGNVSNIIGGNGHLLGDEGSGFYFGKLVIDSYKNNTLSEKQRPLLIEKVNIEAMLKLDPSQTKIKWATLSRELQDNIDDFQNIHEENIYSFLSSHFKNGTPESVSLVGSYAYHHQEIWKKTLSSVGCKVERVIKMPIDRLIE